MNELILNKNDEIVMRLLHYFITEKGYNPIVLHGAKDEIWLENMEGPYKIVRIVTNYIHNDEQLNYDLFKTKQIMKQIKKKTFSLSINALNLFINLGDNVHDFENFDNIACARLNSYSDLTKYEFIINEFPDINKKLEYKEKGLSLFTKIMDDINKKNKDDAIKAEEIFKPKKPIITYILIALNILFALLVISLEKSFDFDANTLYKLGALTNDTLKTGQLYRLFCSMFLHAGIAHLIINMYSLYIIGPQIESFFGKTKYLIIYIVSGLFGSLMSIPFLGNNVIGVGASGAIFGLLSSLVYFGYHYRVYLGGVIKSQIIPLIIFNLGIGFLIPGIGVAAHIGGLIGGFLVTMAVGVKYKSTTYEKINGIIMSLILTIFLIYLGMKVI